MDKTRTIRLGVNLDHVATIRQARFTPYPDLIEAVKITEQAGADGITMHLREDRRHIQTEDVFAAREVVGTTLNLEMAATAEMIKIALQLEPDYCCIVPEKRAELTTEGGLDVIANIRHIADACAKLNQKNIQVSLFIEPDIDVIEAVIKTGATLVELHTGKYAISSADEAKYELQRLVSAAEYAAEKGLQVNAGHGIDYHNIAVIKTIPHLYELNIGHSIVARALFVGLAQAVSEMKTAMIAANDA